MGSDGRESRTVDQQKASGGSKRNNHIANPRTWPLVPYCRRQPPPALHSVGGMVRLDLRGNVVALRPEDVEQLRNAAGARAGSSSRSRDLALVLDWALASPRVVVLRRSEAQELERLVRDEPGLTDLAATIAAAASRAA
jgi:hypothetical protein